MQGRAMQGKKRRCKARKGDVRKGKTRERQKKERQDKGKAYLQQLQHGFAYFVVHAFVSQQLCLQGNRVPEVCVRLTQNMVQVHGGLHRRLLPLQMHPSHTPMMSNI